MADIFAADKIKKHIKLALWYIRKKYSDGRTKNEIASDLENSGNLVIRMLNDELKNSTGKICQCYHKDISLEMAQLLLWIVYKDTAFRDVFFYTLKNILEKNEKLLKEIDQYIVPPEKWYVNLWYKTKENTKKAREKGELSSFEQSYDENIFTPGFQEQEMKRFLDEIQDQKKRLQMFDKDLTLDDMKDEKK